MVLHEAVAVGEGQGEAELVVVKGMGVGVTSEVPIRSASRAPSRPVAESVMLEVGIVKGFGLGKSDGVGVGVGEGGGVGDGVGAAAMLPKAIGPVTVIRTGGRGYLGVRVFALVR